MPWRRWAMFPKCCMDPEYGITLYMGLSFQIYFLEVKTRWAVVWFYSAVFAVLVRDKWSWTWMREGFSMCSSCSSCGHGKERVTPLREPVKMIAPVNTGSERHSCAAVLDISERLGFNRLMRVGNPCKMINAIAGFCWSSVYKYILVVSVTVTAQLTLTWTLWVLARCQAGRYL